MEMAASAARFRRSRLRLPGACAARRIAFILVAILALFPAPAAPAAPSPATAESKETADREIATLIRALEDPGARERIIAALKSGTPAKPDPATEVIDTFGTILLRQASAMIDALGEVRDLVRSSLGDPRGLVQRAVADVRDPSKRAALLGFVVPIAATIAAGLSASLAAGPLPHAARRRALMWAAAGWAWRLPGALLHSLAELAQVAALGAAGYAVLSALQPGHAARLCALALLNAMLATRAACAVARFLLAPFAPPLRLVPIDDETAAYLYVWFKRGVAVLAYGYFALQVAQLLGAPPALHSVALRFAGLIVLALLIAFILQNRRPVADWIGGSAPAAGISRLRALRFQIGRIWHVLALVYLVAAYAVWALQPPGGFAYLWRASFLTVAILAATRAAVGIARIGFAQLMRINHELLLRYPLLERRANRYVPLLRILVETVLWAVAGLAVLDGWELDIARALRASAVEQVAVRAVVVALMLLVAAFVWEATDALITLYLERKDAEGRAITRSTRARTLLPLLRNAVFVAIALLAGLTVLSQLGINIAPLLAGAGVLGLAIGFGAQTLVKDVITGAFILFEDTLNVGDVATINGTGGLVEGMTIRTVRLRDLDGTVHTIPFSAITTVSNMTKGFSYYLLDVAVPYRTATDQVISALQAVFADIKADPRFAADILGELDVLGVDRFAAGAAYVRARIMTRPIRQWDVGREYNRRMKLKFDEIGIELWAPNRYLVLEQAPGLELARAPQQRRTG
jgi:moderate conductance mechanosensitive channel